MFILSVKRKKEPETLKNPCNETFFAIKTKNIAHIVLKNIQFHFACRTGDLRLMGEGGVHEGSKNIEESDRNVVINRLNI